MSNRLAVLPVELVELIADRLNRADILFLRLVCKQLRKKSTDCFSRVFLSVV